MAIRRPKIPAGRMFLIANLFAWGVPGLADFRTYELNGDGSVLTVRTTKAGLMAFAGHEHLVEARGISGQVEWDPEEVALGRVIAEIRLDSLTVLDPDLSETTRGKVQSSMESDVLPLESHPVVRFTSSRQERLEGDRWRVLGDLDFAGQIRPVELNVSLDTGERSIQATGTGQLKLSEFGINSVTAMAGMVKVGDTLDLEFTIMAIEGEE